MSPGLIGVAFSQQNPDFSRSGGTNDTSGPHIHFILAASLVTPACATLATGTSQSISVSSNVDGADLFLDGERIGTTPFTGVVKKNKSMLRAELSGYRTETVTLSKSLEPLFWGNIIIGGTLGSITDFATGAAYQYAPASYQIEMRAADQSEEDFQRQVAVRKFSMLYIDAISRDISRGGGDYLSALIGLVESGKAEPVEEKAIADALARSDGDPVRFGTYVIDLI